MATLEFFFDCSSPWTYLAFHGIEALAGAERAELVWKPILVGGVFNAVNESVYQQRANPVPAKARYYAKDLRDWSRHVGLELGTPCVFPVNSVKAMRGCLVAQEEGRLPAFARRVFERYWQEAADISQVEVLRAIAAETGLEPDAFEARIASPEIKTRLRANTDELIARGGFGSPTMFVDRDDLYFGNDRLPLVREALARRRGAARGAP